MNTIQINKLKFAVLMHHSMGKPGKYEDWTLERKEAYHRDIGMVIDVVKYVEWIGQQKVPLAEMAQSVIHNTDVFFD